jgi:hypothetical protein
MIKRHPNHSLQPTPVGRRSSAFAVDITGLYSCELIRGMLHGFDRGGTGQMRALGRSRKSAVGCGDNFDAV